MPPSVRTPAAKYSVAYGLATAGAAFGFLGVTGAATSAGGRAHAAIATGLLVALYQLSAAVGAPYAARSVRRANPRVAFALILSISALLWIIAGTALLVGAPTMTTLFIGVVPAGILSGLMAVLRPVLGRSYLAVNVMSEVIAKLTVVVGVSWAVGSIIGSWMLSTVALAWGLVIYGLLSLGFASTVLSVLPTVEPVVSKDDVRASDGTWRVLRQNRSVRWAAVLGAAGALFLSPIAALVVPITDAFRHDRPLTGAGLLMASWSIGQLCSPIAVRRLKAKRDELSAGAIATLLCGASLVVMGVASALFAHVVGELAVWIVIGVVFGASRFSAGALYFGAAADSGSLQEAPRHLSAVTFVSLLMAPLGVLACGAVLGHYSAETVVLACGLASVIAGAMVLSIIRRDAAFGPAGITNTNCTG